MKSASLMSYLKKFCGKKLNYFFRLIFKKLQIINLKMKNELVSAANFIAHLVRMSKQKINEATLKKFRDCLIEVYNRRFRNYWFPELPLKGSCYRTIRVFHNKIDPMILQAAEACDISQELLQNVFKFDLTLWINPMEVYYRLGENGSMIIIYDKLSLRHWSPSNVGSYSTANKCICNYFLPHIQKYSLVSSSNPPPQNLH